MIKTLLIYTMISTVVFITGCASTNIESAHSSFKTKITTSGLKHFEVRAKTDTNKNKPRDKSERKRQQRRAKRVNVKHETNKLHDLASRHLDENNFCREGYWTIEVDLDTRMKRLRGECNDVASQSDRESFPDTIVRW